MFFAFLWNNGPDKIKRIFMIHKFGIPCIRTFNDGLKISWVKRFVRSEDAWKKLAESRMPNYNLMFVGGDMSASKVLGNSGNPFWREIVSCWDIFKRCFADEVEDIAVQPLLLSSSFKRDRKVIFKKCLCQAACTYVGDFWSSEGQLMTFTEWVERYGARIQQLEYMGIIRTIRSVCSKTTLSRIIGPVMQPALAVALGNQTGCRVYYGKLIEYRYGSSNLSLRSQVKWRNEIEGELIWDKIYQSFQSCTRNTTLLWFQDKLTHRILTTNTFVSKFSDSSPLCTFCGGNRETLVHLFVDCVEVQAVWVNIEHMIRDRLGCNIRLNKRIIVLGLDEDRLDGETGAVENRNAVQRLILLGKYYIYRSKAGNGRISVTDMKTFFDFYTKAEFSSLTYPRSEAEEKQYEKHKQLCLQSLESLE